MTLPGTEVNKWTVSHVELTEALERRVVLKADREHARKELTAKLREASQAQRC